MASQIQSPQEGTPKFELGVQNHPDGKISYSGIDRREIFVSQWYGPPPNPHLPPPQQLKKRKPK